MCPCHNSNFRGRNQRGFLAVQPLRIEKPTFIYIDRDDTADSVYVKLQRDLNATHLTGFKMLARLKKYDQQIHSGAYRFDASINTLTLFRRLSSGHQTPVKVVIPSVRTLSRLARSLDRQLTVPSALHWVSALKRCLRYSSRIRMKPIGIRMPKPLSNE